MKPTRRNTVYVNGVPRTGEVEARAKAATTAEKPAPEQISEEPVHLDARELDRDSMLALLAGMGIEHNPIEVREPMRTEIDPRVLARRRAAEAEARRQREAQLSTGTIDGRSASPAEVAARLKQITGLDLSPAEFRPVPPPAPSMPDADHTRRDREDRARFTLAQKLIAAHEERRPLNARTLTEDELRIYLGQKGLTGRGDWDHSGHADAPKR